MPEVQEKNVEEISQRVKHQEGTLQASSLWFTIEHDAWLVIDVQEEKAEQGYRTLQLKECVLPYSEYHWFYMSYRTGAQDLWVLELDMFTDI